MSTTTAARVGIADHGRAMTLEEFEDAEFEEGYRYELARGVLEVTQVPRDSHWRMVWTLLSALAIYQRDRPGIISHCGGGGECQLRLPGLVSGRNPDIAVVLRGAPRDRRERQAPALVMEVVSAGAEARDRDLRAKREEYLAFGLLEYWIIDPELRRVLVLTRDGDSWAERVFAEGQAAEGLVLPGFAVPLADLWAGAEGEDDAERAEA